MYFKTTVDLKYFQNFDVPFTEKICIFALTVIHHGLVTFSFKTFKMLHFLLICKLLYTYNYFLSIFLMIAIHFPSLHASPPLLKLCHHFPVLGSSRSSCDFQSQSTTPTHPAPPSLSSKCSTPSSSSTSSALYPPPEDFSLADISQNFGRRGGLSGAALYNSASPSPRSGSGGVSGAALYNTASPTPRSGGVYAASPPIRGSAAAAYVPPAARVGGGAYNNVGTAAATASSRGGGYNSANAQSPSHPAQYSSGHR